VLVAQTAIRFLDAYSLGWAYRQLFRIVSYWGTLPSQEKVAGSIKTTVVSHSNKLGREQQFHMFVSVGY